MINPMKQFIQITRSAQEEKNMLQSGQHAGYGIFNTYKAPCTFSIFSTLSQR